MTTHKNRIRSIRVEIVPELLYSSTDIANLRISVYANGQCHQTNRLMPYDDLVSRYDQYMRTVTLEMKAHLLKEDE